MSKFAKSPFKLTKYRILSSHIDFSSETDGKKLIYTVDLEPQFFIESSKLEETNASALEGKILLKIKIHGKNKPKGKILRSVEVEIEGFFTAEGLSQEVFDNLLKINGTFALLSIVRSYIISTTSQLGFKEPIIIPFINIGPLKEN